MTAGYAGEDPAVREVLGAVDDLTAGLRERAAEAERLCRLPEESVKELREAGFFRLLRPRAFGGLAAPPQAHLAAVGSLAAACASTGWVASVFGVHGWHVSLCAPRTQREVWDTDADALISSSYAPSGTAVPVTGGYTLSGRWSFSSGCDHAQWVLLGAFVTGLEGTPPRMRAFLVPRDDYRIEAAWDTVGLRGTGSNDVLAEDVFVPARRTIGVGPSADRAFPGWESNPEPLYRVPFPAMFTTAVTAPIVGTAAGAYRDHCATLRDRIAAGRPRRGDLDPAGQLRIARGSGDIDASWRQLVGNIAELYAHAERGQEPGLELRARTRRDQVLATERAVAAVDLLMAHAGGNAMRTGSGALQRAWRDVHTGRGHAANDIDRGLLPHAQQALGLDIHEPMV